MLKFHFAYFLILLSFDIKANTLNSEHQIISFLQQQNSQQDPTNLNTSNIKSQENLQALDISNFATFNPNSLYGHNNQNLNLNHYKTKNFIPQGKYYVQLIINQKHQIETAVRFENQDGFESARLCIDAELLKKMELKKDTMSHFTDRPCIRIEKINANASYEFDLSKLILTLNIPQALQLDHPEGYIDPRLFTKGVNSSFLNYDYNASHNNDSDTQYLSLNGGINVYGWYFRHQGSFDSNELRLGQYHSNQNVIYTDIIPWYSRLTLGQFSTQNYHSESLPVLGIQIASDQNMLPSTQQNYTPVIENVANSNAVVKVYQNGIKIYERSVPAGPFKLTDLAATTSGQLTIEIAEINGTVKTFNLNLQPNTRLIKPGQHEFSATIGYYNLAQKMTDELISQFNLNYGLNNYLTLFGGINASQHYQSLLFGTSIATALGAVNFKLNSSQAKLISEDYQGQQWLVDYQYLWPSNGLSIYFNHQHQTREFLTATNVLSKLNYNDLSTAEYKNYYLTNNLKDQFSIHLSKSNFLHKNAGFNLGYSNHQYWDKKQSADQYTLSYSNIWKKLSYTLGYSQTNYSTYDKTDKTVYLNLSVPLDWTKNRAFVNSNIQHIKNDQHRDTANVSISGQLGNQNNFYYGLGLSNIYQNDNHDTSIQAHTTYMLPQMTLGATAYTMRDSQQYSISARGAWVAHQYGITPVNTLSDTFTIIHANHAKGATINNAWGVKLDRFGNAIYPNNSAYVENDIQINTEKLPIDVKMASNQIKVIPRKYSSSLATFDVKKTSNILLRITNKNGVQLPIGSRLLNEQGNFVGMLGQSNQVILEDTDHVFNQKLFVEWGELSIERCEIPPISIMPNHIKQNNQFKIIKVECN